MKFKSRKKTDAEIAAEMELRVNRLAQKSLFDPELEAIEPCPFEFKIQFSDAAGNHEMECGDWETRAAFFKLSRRYGQQATLTHLKNTYENEYANRGVAFALGTVKKRPLQWLLLGILRLDKPIQQNLF